MANEELLRKIELFAEMTDEELQAVGKCIDEEIVQADQTVIEEGKPGKALYLIKTGKVQIMKNLGKSEIAIAELQAGSAFGEMSLLDDFPSSASVKTVEESEFLTIGRLDLNVLLNWDTVLASKMWRSFARMLSGRLRDANNKITDSLLMKQKDKKTREVTKDILATSHRGDTGN
ncbi:cyclic nucleotide-binding domain-containing protein [Acidobacteriota bacterium]